MITVRIDYQTHLGPLSEIPGQVATQIRDRLSFPNPAHQEAQRRGFSTWNIPQQIQGYRVEADALIIPRGFTRQLVGILRGAVVWYRINDKRRTLAQVYFTYYLRKGEKGYE